jgi:hypothetical protein
MATTREQNHATYCPECNEPVYRRSQFRGKIRFYHRNSQKLDCQWRGTDAIGYELEVMSGVPREQAETLRRQIIKERGSRATYVITAAQNATPVHENALKSLLTYCRVNKAQLLVVPYRYRNPTSRWSKAAEHDDWWTGPVLPYLINHRLNLNKHLMLMGDVMIQPTAVRPLEGFESITGAQSGIFGHPKLELTTVPTPQADLPKILTTTGAITKKNYIPSKAGKKGEFHHTFGATVVEINGDRFYMRQLNMAKDGSFCDLLTEYDGDKTRDYARIPGLVMGDTHVTVIDPGAVAATFDGPKSIVETLKPEQLVWHDLYDGSAKNHHERGRVFHDYVRYKCNRDDVEAEVRSTFAFIDNHNPVNYTRHIIVPSNHGDFLREWVENTDPRRDPKNCMFWAESFQAILKSDATTWTDAGVTVQDLVAYWGKKLLKVAGRTTFLRRDQTHRIKGIEVSYHGDKGPGGKPGSREGFRKIGVKSIIGHGHGPGIEEGCYQVGTTSRLNLTYAAGTPSGWLHCHAAILPNGKRQLLIIVEGKWRP